MSARRPADEAAARLLETIPLVMRMLRRDVRLQSGDALSIPRFHSLLFIRRHPGTDLSGLSEYLGATLPATSELVTRLVAGGLVSRMPNDAERRRVCLLLTDAGAAELDATRAAAQAVLARLVGELEPAELRSLTEVMERLHGLLVPREPDTT